MRRLLTKSSLALHIANGLKTSEANPAATCNPKPGCASIMLQDPALDTGYLGLGSSQTGSLLWLQRRGYTHQTMLIAPQPSDCRKRKPSRVYCQRSLPMSSDALAKTIAAKHLLSPFIHDTANSRRRHRASPEV